MVRQDEQPRPDLDAAIDAVAAALTVVSDDTVAASMRRTRIALAEGRGRLRSGWPASPWRWALPAAVAVAAGAIAAVALWPTASIDDGPRVAATDVAPASAIAPLSTTPLLVAPSVSAPGQVVPTHLGRGPRIATTTTPAPRRDDAPRPDPLAALVRAVQQIPEDAWNASVARANAPVAAAAVPVAPIDVTPLDTQPIADVSAQPIALGEP